MTLFGLEDVHFAYDRKPILERFSLQLVAGGVVGLLGPTGCGKSTVLRLLAGLEVPAAGKVYCGAGAVAGDGFTFVPAEKRGCAMVFQNLGLWPHLSVAESLELVLEGGSGSRASKDIPEIAARRILEEMEIADLATRRPAQLSGGQAALAAVARALAQDPKFLLLDEPFSGLDADLRTQIRDRVFAIVRLRGLPALYVTHMREEALATVDRLALLHNGKILQEDSPEEIYRRPLSAIAARLTGEAGLVPAEITASNIVIPGACFPRSFSPRAQQLGTGWKGLALFRPGKLQLAGDGNIPGRVISCRRSGGRFRVEVGIGGLPVFTVPLDSATEMVPGLELRLANFGDIVLVENESC